MMCPRCHTENAPYATSCVNCGLPRGVAAPMVAPEGATPSRPLAPPAPYSGPYSAPYAPLPSQPIAPYPYQGQPSQPYPPMALVPQPSMALAVNPASGGLRHALLGEGSWLTALPLWLALAAVPLTLATFVLATITLRRDWADGAQFAGVVIAVLVVAALVAGAIVIIRRGAQPLMALLTGALLLVLMVSGVGALVGQPAIHSIQAGSLEHDRAWTAAIREYTLAGEQPPHAPNIARVHLEWGEDLLSQAKFQDAVSFFYIAQGDDTGNTSVVARATRDIYRAFHLWFVSDVTTFTFGSAIAFLTRYPASADCDASCAQDIHQFAAQLKFTWAHDVYLPTVDCARAVPIYQDLAANYADTVYGTQAGSALLAPVDVSGSIVSMPASLRTGTRVYLSSIVSPDTHDYIRYFSDDYSALLDSSAGFTFHNVRPGKYNFSLLLATNQRWYWNNTVPFDAYIEVVQPLCGPTVTVFSWT